MSKLGGKKGSGSHSGSSALHDDERWDALLAHSAVLDESATGEAPATPVLLDEEQLRLREHQARVLLARWKSFRAEDIGLNEDQAVPPQLQDPVGAEVVGRFCHATSTLVQKLIWDATSRRDSLGLPPRARIEGVREAPYVEVVPLNGSWLANNALLRDGTVRVQEPEMVGNLSLTSGLSLAESRWCWRALARCLCEAPDVLPDLTAEVRQGAIELSIGAPSAAWAGALFHPT